MVSMREFMVRNINGMNGCDNMTEFRKTIQKLLDSEVTGYQIYMKTGISQARISELRRGKRKIGGIALDTAEKLYLYQKDIENGSR